MQQSRFNTWSKFVGREDTSLYGMLIEHYITSFSGEGTVARLVNGALAVPGLLISLYFTAVYRRVVPSVDRFVPRFCRIEPATCTKVLEAEEARYFGVPNFYLGLVFYSGFIGLAFLPELWREVYGVLFVASLMTVLLGIYLSYVLVFRLSIRCTLCFVSHTISLLMFLVLLTAR